MAYRGDILTAPSEMGAWGWVGCRLRPADLPGPPEAAPLLERAWLAERAAPLPVRMELRFESGGRPGEPLTATLLGQVHSADAAAAPGAAGSLGERLLDLPSHVVAEPLDASGLRAALAPEPLAAAVQRYGGAAAAVAAGGLGLVEIRRLPASAPMTRPDSASPIGVAFEPLAAQPASWEPVWTELAARDRPTVLGVCLEPYPISPAFAAALRQLHDDYERLTHPLRANPLFGRDLPPEPFARRAVPLYRAALARYTHRAFRARISLAAAGPPPLELAGLVARTMSRTPGALAAREPVPAELDAAWADLAGLGRTWLEATYRLGVPRPLSQLERVLSDLLDPDEATAVFRLPAEAPEGPRRFATARPGGGAWAPAAPGPPAGADPGRPDDF
ncbi:hypothetical protein E1265_22010 [Streptomyces sp. 8K308]|uniref:hypothetical protein n=1 Tax=Streptomyces sp. 8K308 TaxID=2530388 RepID=UPI0010454186|nr:hypothetical protein [Streptomyces sp. 8K308]TDC20486.1 hypothetical protein E1265_22010 [Streptomyces sp. 8K308]